MRNVIFTNGVIPEESDFNALSTNVEAAFLALTQGLSGGLSGALYQDLAPTAVINGANVDITIPAQKIAVGSSTVDVPATVQSVVNANKQVGIYFRVTKSDVTDTRTFVNTVPSTPTEGSATYTVAQDDSFALLISESADENTVPTTPTADPDDVASPILFAIVTIDTGVVTVVHDPDGYRIGNTAVAGHAASHLTGGSDPIALATATTDGLSSSVQFQVSQVALTNFSIAASAPLARSIGATDNSAGPSRSVVLGLNIGNGVVSALDSGTYKLSADFATGARAGSSTKVARSDHSHGTNTTPFQEAETQFSVSSAAMGTQLNMSLSSTFGKVMGVAVFWTPPGISSPMFPLVDCGYHPAPATAQMVGARAYVSSSNSIRIQLGDYGLVRLSGGELSAATTAAGGVTWSSADGGGIYPTSGTLTVRVSGVR